MIGHSMGRWRRRRWRGRSAGRRGGGDRAAERAPPRAQRDRGDGDGRGDRRRGGGGDRGREDRLSVAVSNGPRLTVIAGEPTALDEVLAELTAAGVFCRRVKVDVASHSPQMDPLCPRVAAALAEVAPVAASVPIRSTVTGTTLRGDEMVADYWVDNLRRPVLFDGRAGAPRRGERGVHRDEPAPDPGAGDRGEPRGPRGRRLRADVAAAGAGRAHVPARVARAGVCPRVDVDLARVSLAGGRRVELPAYPVAARALLARWRGGPARGGWGRRRPRAERQGHPLLGAAIAVSTRAGERIWEQAIGLEALPLPRRSSGRRGGGRPGAAYIEAATAAASEVPGAATTIVLERLFVRSPPRLPASGARQVQVVLNARGARGTFQIASGEGGRWTRHASGEVRGGPGGAGARGARAPGGGHARGGPGGALPPHAGARIEYGPAFSLITGLWIGEGRRSVGCACRAASAMTAIGCTRRGSTRACRCRLAPDPRGRASPTCRGASRVTRTGGRRGRRGARAASGAQAGGADERAGHALTLDAEGGCWSASRASGRGAWRARGRRRRAREDLARGGLSPGGGGDGVAAARRGVAGLRGSARRRGALVERLVAHGQRCVRVIAGDEFRAARSTSTRSTRRSSRAPRPPAARGPRRRGALPRGSSTSGASTRLSSRRRT